MREYFGPINTEDSEDGEDEDEEQEESEEEDVDQDEVDEEKQVLQSKMVGISNVLMQEEKGIQAATKALADASAAAVDAKKDEDSKLDLMLKAAEAQAVSPTEETLAALNEAQKAHAEAKLFSVTSTHHVSMAQQALHIKTAQQSALANVLDSAAGDSTDAAGGKAVSSGKAEEPAPSAGSGTLPDPLPLAHLGAGEGMIELGKHMGSQIDNQ